MNPKRLILGIVAVFVGVWLTDFLIHGLWLQARYSETMSLWRSEADMQKHIGWLFLGQFLAAAAFVAIWAAGFAAGGHLTCACLYGGVMGLFSQAATFITFAVTPLPRDIAVKWVLSGLVQGILLGLLVFFVYKPKREDRLGAMADPSAPKPA